MTYLEEHHTGIHMAEIRSHFHFPCDAIGWYNY